MELSWAEMCKAEPLKQSGLHLLSDVANLLTYKNWDSFISQPPPPCCTKKGDIINIIYISRIFIPLSSHPRWFLSKRKPLLTYIISELDTPSPPLLPYPTLPCFCALIVPILHCLWLPLHLPISNLSHSSSH